jgi:hypothetical protein
VVKCFDGSIVDEVFITPLDLLKRVGAIVAIQYTTDDRLWLLWM